jgi:hypothetical protein
VLPAKSGMSFANCGMARGRIGFEPPPGSSTRVQKGPLSGEQADNQYFYIKFSSFAECGYASLRSGNFNDKAPGFRAAWIVRVGSVPSFQPTLFQFWARRYQAAINNK